jgi:serine phosphatase RsbU (regulator of sigma subunit)
MTVRRLLGRLTRADSPSHDIASIPSGAPPPPPFSVVESLPGRLFILSSALLLVILAVQFVVTLPPIAVMFRRVVSVAFIFSGIWLAGLFVRRQWTRFIWRVRRKLILSYLFVGLVPVVLVTVLSAAAALVLYLFFAAFMFHQGMSTLRENITQIVDTSAVEFTRNAAAAESGLTRKVANLKEQYPALSMAVVRVPAPSPPARAAAARPESFLVASAGPWQHQPPPAAVPEWVSANGGFAGIIYAEAAVPASARLVIRAASPTRNGLMVIADLPLDGPIIASLEEKTGTRVDDVIPADPTADGTFGSNGRTSMFREAVALVNATEWSTGKVQGLTIQLHAPVRDLYARLTADQSASLKIAAPAGWTGLLILFGVAASLLLVVLASALFFGVLLGRQITSAVHEMFIGTERVRQGDFSHRIKIESRDQLGELAESFNRMSASVAHLLHVQREKQRLDEELRIARDIQKSLLPPEPPKIAGLSIADLCEPAREVGGDYYDFFAIGPRQLGVLVADVSGKGTSAALYMAELKGLMLSLSHAERSPRRLLVTVNRLLAGHLDNRSFITMTYAIVDLEAGTLTSARAGHTPMIVVSGGGSQVIAPEGMVLGLRLPGASERFEQILQEDTRRIACGDVIVLYTDGITEAMDRSGELFGDAALARVLSSQRDLDAAGIRERVLREVRAFVGDAEQHDDMTMVVLKIGAGGIG